MSPPAPQTGLQHHALFYDDDDEFFAAAVHFVRQGVERGEAVLVNTGTNPVTALLRALFSSEDAVVFADSPVYAKPVSAIDRYRREMDRGLGGEATGYRAMGFIDFDHGYLPWHEWLRYEAAVNQVFEHYPFQTLCPYDTGSVEAQIVSAMRCAHPTVLEGGSPRSNREYVEPAALVTRPDLVTPADPLQFAEPLLELSVVDDLRSLRMDLYPSTILSGLPRKDVDDFVKAVGEVAGNAWTHGTGPVRLRLWAAPDRLVCTVTDQGPGIQDPLRGYARGTSEAATHEGLGLWAARQLVDVLDYARSEDGFTVRLVTYRH